MFDLALALVGKRVLEAIGLGDDVDVLRVARQDAAGEGALV